MIKILLVDDHKVIRDGLRLLLDDHPDMQVVGRRTTVEMPWRWHPGSR